MGHPSEHHGTLFMVSNDSKFYRKKWLWNSHWSSLILIWDIYDRFYCKWPINKLCATRILNWKSISDKCAMKNMRQSEMFDWQSHRELKKRAVDGFKLNEIKNKDGQTSLIKTQILICTLDGRVNLKRSLKNHVPPIWSTRPDWTRW